MSRLQLDLRPDPVARIGLLGLAALALGGLLAWCGQRADPPALLLSAFLGLGTLFVTRSLWKELNFQGRLLQQGESGWTLEAAGRPGVHGRLWMRVDLGDWMLLGFEPRRRLEPPLTLALSRSAHPLDWVVLRAALMSSSGSESSHAGVSRG